MPPSLNWSPDLDEKLSFLLKNQKLTMRKAAEAMGVSRSFIHRRSQKIHRETELRTCSFEREQAGLEPLAVGHPISWLAIEIRKDRGRSMIATTINAGNLAPGAMNGGSISAGSIRASAIRAGSLKAGSGMIEHIRI